MILLIMACFFKSPTLWTARSNVHLTSMLGMNGEQIAWAQLEMNAGQQSGKDCVALFSLNFVELRQDCSECVSASTLVFTEDIQTEIEPECQIILGDLSTLKGQHWSLGYTKSGQIMEWKQERWQILSSQIEDRMGMIVFEVD